MADEFVNVTVNGHTFDVRVPKGSSDDFVSKAAQDHYNTKYATESGPMNPVMPPPVTKDPEFQKMEQSGGEGFWKSLGKSAGNIWDQVTQHPIDTVAGMFPQTQQKQYYDPNDPSKESYEEAVKHLSPVIENSNQPGAFFKATHGNIPGAIGDITPDAILAAAVSPKIRGIAKGVGKGIANANYPRMGISRLGLPGVIGGGIAAASGNPFWEGAGIGAGTAAAAKSIPPMVRSVGREVPIATEGKSWIPQIIGDIPPGTNFSGETQPRVGAAPLPSEQKILRPATQIQMPAPLSSEQKLLGPATQIQMPPATQIQMPAPINNINPNPNMPGWEDEMEQARRGSSDAPIQPPNPKNPRNKYDETRNCGRIFRL